MGPALALLGAVGWEDPRLCAVRARLLAATAMAVLGYDALKQLLRGSPLGALLIAVALIGSALAVRLPKRTVGHWIGLLGVAAYLGITFPTTANHGYLTLWAAGLATACLQLRQPADRPAVLAVAKWLVVAVLIGSGVQKLLHGCYDHGEYFAYHLARGTPRFDQAWSLALPAEEVVRLRGLPASNGPYGFAAPAAIALSLAIPALEIALGMALLVPATRAVAAVAATFFVVAIQAIAGEIAFAMLMLGLLATFVRVRKQLFVVRLAVATLFCLSVALATGTLSPDDIN